MKNFRRLCATLLLSLGVIPSCATVGAPPPPTLSLYIHSAQSGRALCVRVPSAEDCPALKVSDTNKFYMMSPGDWQAMQNYIDNLVRAIQGGPTFMSQGSPRVVPVSVSDVQMVNQAVRGAAQRLRAKAR